LATLRYEDYEVNRKKYDFTSYMVDIRIFVQTTYMYVISGG